MKPRSTDVIKVRRKTDLLHVKVLTFLNLHLAKQSRIDFHFLNPTSLYFRVCGNAEVFVCFTVKSHFAETWLHL